MRQLCVIALLCSSSAGSATPLSQRDISLQRDATAYDAAGKRLFGIEHGKAKHVLHILSLADSI